MPPVQPSKPEFGVRGLAGTAIFCAYNQSTLVQGASHSLASRTSNPGIKAAYSACASITDTVGEKVTLALNSWGEGNYGDAEKQLRSARQSDIPSCRDKLNDAFNRAGNPPLPADLGAKFKGLLALVTVAEQIVEQIR
ncbi:hypothetical protein Ancab_019515 [Ancistrocladus abbreviatus]